MNKIFVDYLRGYINIHNELLSIDVIDNPNSESKKKYEILNKREEWLNKQLDKYKDIELETTQEEIERIKLEKDLRENTKEKAEFLNNQEENRKKYDQLIKGKEGILENAKREKDERLEEANNNLNSSELMKKYKISIQREEWLNKQLDKYKNIELETTQEEIERIKLEKDLRENAKEKEDCQKQIKEKRAEIKNIGKEYSNFKNQIQFIDNKKQKIEIKDETVKEDVTVKEEMKNIKNKSIQQEESEKDIKLEDLEDKINKESDKIINDTEKDIEDDGRNESKEAKKHNIEIILGRSGKIVYGDQEFKVSKKDIKKGINFDLSDIQEMCLHSNLLVNSEKETFAKLGEMFKNEEVDGLVVHAIMCAKDMDDDVRLELLGKYAKDLKNLDENNIKNNTCNLTYDLDDLSRTNIISRLFRREVNIYEKDEINDRAVMAAEKGIGEVKGEYRPSWISRVVSSIKNRRLGSRENFKLLSEGKEELKEEKVEKNNGFKESLQVDKEIEEKVKAVSTDIETKYNSKETENDKGFELGE